MAIHENVPTLEHPVSIETFTSADAALWQPHSHWHEALELILVQEGSFSIKVEHQVLPLQAGQGIFINQNRIHTIVLKANQEFSATSTRFLPSLVFHGDNSAIADRYLSLVLESPDIPYLVLDRESRDTGDLLLLLRQLLLTCQNRNFGYELDVKAMFCRLWKQLALLALSKRDVSGPQPSHSDNLRIKSALRFIEEHFAEPLTLENIASSIHTSNSECCRCFKRTLGVTPFEYLLKYRVYEASILLLTETATNQSISGLAASVGFNSPSYFNKKFKEYLHCTPKEYRENYLQTQQSGVRPKPERIL